MNPDMQTSLLNTYPRKSVEETAGPAPELPHGYDHILKEGRQFWEDFSGGYLPEDAVLAARREEIDWSF